MSNGAVIHKKITNRSSIAAEEYVFLQTDSSGIIISASEQFCDFAGRSNKELVGLPLTRIIGKNDLLKLSTFLRKEKIPGTVRFSLSLKGKKKARPFQFSVHYITGTNNRNFLLNWCVVSKKVGKPERVKKPLHLISRTFDSNPQPVLIYNPANEKIIYANKAACEFYRYSVSEFTRLSFADLLIKNETGSSAYLSGQYCVARSRAPVDIFLSPIEIGNKSFQLVFTTINPPAASDITFVSQVKNELEKDYADAWEVLDIAPEIFFKLDSAGNFAYVSNEFEKVFGFTKREIQGVHFTSIVFPADLEIANQGFADIFQFGRAKGNVIFRVIKKHGGFEWASTSAIFVFDDEGKPVHCIGFAQIITEIKQLVEKLEASEERYEAFINHSSEAIWRFETAEPLPVDLPEEQLILEFLNKGYLAECNDQMAKLYGFEEASDLAGTPLIRFISPADEGTLNYFKGFIQSGFKLVNIETHETDREGNQKIFLNNLLGIVEHNKLVRVWGTQRDITEHRLVEKKAKEQLEHSESFFKSLISDSLDGIIILDKNAAITYAADSLKNVLGFSPGEVLGKSCFEFIHPEDIALAQNTFNKFNSGKIQDIEIRFQSAEGKWLWMFVRSTDLSHQPSINGLVVYFTDITQRKFTESILKESEKRFRHLADTVPVMIWVVDENDKPTYVSKYWSDFTGVSLEKILNYGWKNAIHPDDHAAAVEKYQLHIARREPFVIEYRVRPKVGEYKWVVDHGVPRFTQDGVFIGYIGTVIDIHYRKTAEQKLLYQAGMIENISDAIVSTDLDFSVIAWNSTAEEIYGITKEEAVGRDIRILVKQRLCFQYEGKCVD